MVSPRSAVRRSVRGISQSITGVGGGLVQLLIGLLLSVGLPWFLRATFDPIEASFDSQRNAIIGTGVALLAGHFFLRSLTSFPGIRSANYAFPTFAISYGLVLVVFFFFRIDYSRIQFVASFALCISWYLTSFLWRRYEHRPQLGIVAAGNAVELARLPGAKWVSLHNPAVHLTGLDGIVADLRADMSDDWERFLAESAISGVPVYHYKQIQESLTGRVEIEHLSENNFGSLIPGLGYVTVKYVADIAAGLVALVLLAPLFALTAMVIRADSPGPIFFRQKRMGYRGEVFTVYKFRTMIDVPAAGGADERTRAITTEGDARITKIGAFLRRSRIDELPQILNIIRGEMSWIGPRPEAVVLSRWYEKELPFYRYRHIVRPGISGWAQVNQGHVANVDEVLWKLHYDFYYIKNFTPWLDLLITFRTVHTMLTGFGAR